ncbi:hypothetical protein M3Y98_00147800 [Aphelenchoides besseyi]|nr:hypothetical protein M3Y98_00147800 [Aphelenchoides besseyi]KAI6199772.1 hypothetical protein M3Y96_00662300 [Aphelenchoides besseyi]
MVSAVLPYPLFELPINDQPDCIDYSPDCFEKAGLCKNEVFKEIMREKCPKTCRICGEIIKDVDEIVDIFDSTFHKHSTSNNAFRPFITKTFPEWSRTFSHNNDRDEYTANIVPQEQTISNDEFENNEEYQNSEEFISESFEHQQLTTRPPTIVYPQPLPQPPVSTIDHSVSSSFHRRKTPCRDQAPNCFYLKSLCFNQFYLPLLASNCKRTCGFCRKQEKSKWNTISKGTRLHSRTSTPAYGVCRDLGIDCDEKLKLCLNPIYVKFMRKFCSLSCGFCYPDY